MEEEGGRRDALAQDTQEGWDQARPRTRVAAPPLPRRARELALSTAAAAAFPVP
jgi:hypothetical protein